MAAASLLGALGNVRTLFYLASVVLIIPACVSYVYTIGCASETGECKVPGFDGIIYLRYDARYVVGTTERDGESFEYFVGLPYNFGSGSTRLLLVTCLALQLLASVILLVFTLSFVTYGRAKGLSFRDSLKEPVPKNHFVLLYLVVLLLCVYCILMADGMAGTISDWNEASDIWCTGVLHDDTPCNHFQGSNIVMKWGPRHGFTMTAVRSCA